MPEGHTIHRYAARHRKALAGQTVATASPQGRFSGGASRLNGRKLLDVDAHGKHLFYRFDSGEVLHVHLGLFGKFRVRSLPAPEPSPNARLVMETATDHLHLAGPTVCELLDPDGEDALRARLGPDPILDPADGADRLVAKLARRSISIGAALHDQSVVAGIGNVYVQDPLFKAGIHPLRPINTLSGDELARLWEALREKLQESIGNIIEEL